jgi:hypothetical protein
MCHSALPQICRGRESTEPAHGTVPSARARGHFPAWSGPLQPPISAPSESRQMVTAPGCLGRVMSAGCGNEKLERALRTGWLGAGAVLSRAEPPRESTPHRITHTTGARSAAISRGREARVNAKGGMRHGLDPAAPSGGRRSPGRLWFDGWGQFTGNAHAQPLAVGVHC